MFYRELAVTIDRLPLVVCDDVGLGIDASAKIDELALERDRPRIVWVL